MTALEPASAVDIRAVSKSFAGVVAVDGVSLSLGRGEFFSLLGPSGSGKTTLLRILAGLDRPDAGRVLIDGIDMTDMAPYRRPVNLMFQSYALFPHLSVFDNVAFGLRREGLGRDTVRRRVADMLDLLEIGPLAARRPHQLSGGERQRVALARALAKQPSVLLLDEPLAALDRQLRARTQLELARLQRRVGITFILVTHDQEEAMTLSSRIAVMRAGRVVQVDTPRMLYERPASRYVAEFVGTANLFEGKVLGVAGGLIRVATSEGDMLVAADGTSPATGARVAVVVRPEKFRLGPVSAGARHNRVSGRVREVAYFGDHTVYRLQTAAGSAVRLARAHGDAAPPLAMDAAVEAWWPPESGVVLVE